MTFSVWKHSSFNWTSSDYICCIFGYSISTIWCVWDRMGSRSRLSCGGWEDTCGLMLSRRGGGWGICSSCWMSSSWTSGLLIKLSSTWTGSWTPTVGWSTVISSCQWKNDLKHSFSSPSSKCVMMVPFGLLNFKINYWPIRAAFLLSAVFEFAPIQTYIWRSSSRRKMSLVSRWLLYRGLSLISVVFIDPEASEILKYENLASASSPRFRSKHLLISFGLPPSSFQNSSAASSSCFGNTIWAGTSLVWHLLILSQSSRLTFFLSSLQSSPCQKYSLC